MGKIYERAELARSILEAVSQFYNIDVPSIVGRAKYKRVQAVRRQFCKMAYEAGVGSVTIGKVLNRDHTTILYHVRPHWRARKNAWRFKQIQRRASARADSRGCENV